MVISSMGENTAIKGLFAFIAIKPCFMSDNTLIFSLVCGISGIITNRRQTIAKAAPSISTIIMEEIGRNDISAAPSTGPIMLDIDWIIFPQPPALVNISAGTNMGIAACIAGP
ncbi:hypothetical protein SDC9_151518 [bioreactor metagenome]|uniref:Uncharacterized protein n=1 Tax=bioreactor metagenome TaxID=1076179 RepID=A0A645ESL9_9ZZZZ